MSDLSKALAAVGESAPERPKTTDLRFHEPGDRGYDNECDLCYIERLESLALRLARRLAEAEKQRGALPLVVNEFYVPKEDDICPACDGCGDPDNDHHNPIPCHLCGGTGKKQQR